MPTKLLKKIPKLNNPELSPDVFFNDITLPSTQSKSNVFPSLIFHWEVGVRFEGEVTWFNEQKGFGFITGEDGKDVFVHYTEIVRDGFQTLETGERVTYTLTDEEVGPKATDVRLQSDGSGTTLL